jgi:nucleoside-diphosphate-sugar epimerase
MLWRTIVIAKTALVVGASGIVGSSLARHLSAADGRSTGWRGVRQPALTASYRSQPTCSIRNRCARHSATSGRATSSSASGFGKKTEAENITVNRSMVRNVLEALSPGGSVEHAALVTGLKHYLGPFESYGKGPLPPTPFRETQPRLDIENFYYAQEDELFAAASRDGFGWSVDRPHTIIGYAIGNAMNMGVTLAAYATICRATGWPFLFPGSAMQWNGLTDMTDAGLLARHLEWTATTAAARNQAFNVVNGDVFRWSWMWSRIAEWFDLEPAPFPGEGMPLERQLSDAGPIWAGIARDKHLVGSDLGVIASAWHTDADLGRPIEVVTDMSKSRKLGFLDYQATDEAFFALFKRLRESRIIP